MIPDPAKSEPTGKTDSPRRRKDAEEAQSSCHNGVVVE